MKSLNHITRLPEQSKQDLKELLDRVFWSSIALTCIGIFVYFVGIINYWWHI